MLTAEQRRRYLRETGRPSIVPADEAVAHVRYLHDVCGLTFRAMAALTHGQVHDSTLADFYVGRRTGHSELPITSTRRTTANAVLSIRAGFQYDSKSLVSACGTRRRLQALAHRGFGAKHLAAITGQEHKQMWRYMTGPQSGRHVAKYVQIRSRETIRVWYEKLRNADPADYGGTPFSIKRAKTLAYQHGWATDACWDEDTWDDPDAIPEWTGKCGTAQGYRIHHRDDIGKGAIQAPEVRGPHDRQIDVAANLSHPAVRRMARTIPTRFQKTMLHVTADYPSMNVYSIICKDCRNCNTIMLRYPELGYLLGIQERDARGKYSRNNLKEE